MQRQLVRYAGGQVSCTHPAPLGAQPQNLSYSGASAVCFEGLRFSRARAHAVVRVVARCQCLTTPQALALACIIASGCAGMATHAAARAGSTCTRKEDDRTGPAAPEGGVGTRGRTARQAPRSSSREPPPRLLSELLQAVARGHGRPPAALCCAPLLLVGHSRMPEATSTRFEPPIHHLTWGIGGGPHVRASGPGSLHSLYTYLSIHRTSARSSAGRVTVAA